ncbi:MAG: glycosyltransferase family 2 protein [Nocardioidaceae bacterium]
MPSSRRDQPRLSVVVPVFNVKPYVADCLDSILGQDVEALEIIVVDDGSTDGSAALIADYASRHSHVCVITTPHRSLSAARNTGARAAVGDYLAFADSDDLVLPGAYQLMLSTLEQSGSDFAVGSMQRNFPGGNRQPAAIAAVHTRRRLHVTLRQFPGMLRDIFAWNKVFRRSAWQRLQLSYPEGVRYEDQPTLTRAYLAGATFDVLRKPVYLWRIREDGTSITQQRHLVDDLRDRLETKLMTSDLIDREGWPEVRRLWYGELLWTGLPLYFREIPGCDDTYWQVLREGLRALQEGRPKLSASSLSAPNRLIAWLVEHDLRAEAERVLAFVDERSGAFEIETRGVRRLARLPLLDDPSIGVPVEVYVVRSPAGGHPV